MEQVPAVLASPQNLAAIAYRRLWAEVEDRLDLEAPKSAPVDLDAIASTGVVGGIGTAEAG